MAGSGLHADLHDSFSCLKKVIIWEKKNERKKSQQSFDMFYWFLFDVCKVYCEDKLLAAKEIFFLQ